MLTKRHIFRIRNTVSVPLHNHDPGLALIAHRPMTGEAARDRRIMGWFNALVCRTQRHLLTCSSLFSSVRNFFRCEKAHGDSVGEV